MAQGRRRRSSRSPATRGQVTRETPLPVEAANDQLAGFKGRLHSVKVIWMQQQDGLIARMKLAEWLSCPLSLCCRCFKRNNRRRNSSLKMEQAYSSQESKYLLQKASAGVLMELPGEHKLNYWILNPSAVDLEQSSNPPLRYGSHQRIESLQSRISNSIGRSRVSGFSCIVSLQDKHKGNGYMCLYALRSFVSSSILSIKPRRRDEMAYLAQRYNTRRAGDEDEAGNGKLTGVW